MTNSTQVPGPSLVEETCDQKSPRRCYKTEEMSDELRSDLAELVYNGKPLDWAWWKGRLKITPQQAAKLVCCIDPITWPEWEYEQGKIPREFREKIERLTEWLWERKETWTLATLADVLSVDDVPAPMREALETEDTVNTATPPANTPASKSKSFFEVFGSRDEVLERIRKRIKEECSPEFQQLLNEWSDPEKQGSYLPGAEYAWTGLQYFPAVELSPEQTVVVNGINDESSEPEESISASENILVSKKQRNDRLAPVIKAAQAACADPTNANEIFLKLEEWAKEPAPRPPLVGVQPAGKEVGVLWQNNWGEEQRLTMKRLRDRLRTKRSKTV